MIRDTQDITDKVNDFAISYKTDIKYVSFHKHSLKTQQGITFPNYELVKSDMMVVAVYGCINSRTITVYVCMSKFDDYNFNVMLL